MASLRVSQVISAPPARVFEAFTDLARAPERVPAIKKLEILTAGPVGAGTRFRETRVMFKQHATEEMEITIFEPPQRYGVGCTSGGVRFETTFTFSPVAAGTEVVVEVQTQALTTMARLMATVMGAAMRGMLTKCITGDVLAIKTYIETGQPVRA